MVTPDFDTTGIGAAAFQRSRPIENLAVQRIPACPTSSRVPAPHSVSIVCCYLKSPTIPPMVVRVRGPPLSRRQLALLRESEPDSRGRDYHENSRILLKVFVR